MTRKPVPISQALARAQTLSRTPKGWGEAATIYRMILAQKPNHVAAKAGLELLEAAMEKALPDAIKELNGLMNKGRWAEAKGGLENLLRVNPRVPVLPNLYGIVMARLQQPARAVDSFSQAVKLAPTYVEARTNLATALRQIGKTDLALAEAREAVRLEPKVAAARVVLGQLLDDTGQPTDALAEYTAALATQPNMLGAHDGIIRLHEKAGDLDAMRGAIEQAEAAIGKPHPVIMLYRGQMHVRASEDREAIDVLERIRPAKLPPEIRASRSEMLGKAADRLGETADALVHFTDANTVSAAHAWSKPGADNPYMKQLEQRRTDIAQHDTTPWPTDPSGPATGSSPVFLVSFPCSGTTMLERILRAHPGISIPETQDFLAPIRAQLGNPETLEDLATLSDSQLAEARAAYLSAFDAALPGPANKIRIDRMSLNLGNAALIHRLFPQAHYILMLRHPCDCVLSGFMQTFGSSAAMDNFLTLPASARLYDQVMSVWTLAATRFDLPVTELRYESLVEDVKESVEPVLTAIGATWSDDLLDDHLQNAAEGIASPSDRQIGAALHEPTVDHWRRYEQAMEDVLPILEPWIARWGYNG